MNWVRFAFTNHSVSATETTKSPILIQLLWWNKHDSYENNACGISWNGLGREPRHLSIELCEKIIRERKKKIYINRENIYDLGQIYVDTSFTRIYRRVESG